MIFIVHLTQYLSWAPQYILLGKTFNIMVCISNITYQIKFHGSTLKRKWWYAIIQLLGTIEHGSLL